MPTYDEVRATYCESMGPELGTVYHLMWNECAFLHVRWHEYVAMFGKTQAEFDVMNEVAPGFFKSVQDNAWEHTLLHLCRFADNAKVSGKKTLSLESLLKIPASQAVPDLAKLVHEAKATIKFTQDFRNRFLAHADLEHALNKEAKPISPASRTNVKEALGAIHIVLEAMDNHFTGSRLYFGDTGRSWGGTHLLRELRLLAHLRKEREDRINSGTGTQDDLNYKKWNDQ